MDSPDIVKAQTTLEDRPELERKGETVRTYGTWNIQQIPDLPALSHTHPPTPFLSHFYRLLKPCACSKWATLPFCAMRLCLSTALTDILAYILPRNPTP